MCGKLARPIRVDVEHLKPMRESQPSTQFTVLGKCGHLFKVSAEEMGTETLSSIIKEPLWLRIRRVMTG